MPNMGVLFDRAFGRGNNERNGKSVYLTGSCHRNPTIG
jgi:hypothetical protein